MSRAVWHKHCNYWGNKMDKTTNAKIIASMFACYGQGQDGVRIAAYTNMLSGIPTEILSRVCKKLILESKFLPTVADIVEASRSLIGTIDESSRTKPWAGKVPRVNGEGPTGEWGRSTFVGRTFPNKMPPQYPLLPNHRGRSPPSNSTFPK